MSDACNATHRSYTAAERGKVLRACKLDFADELEGEVVVNLDKGDQRSAPKLLPDRILYRHNLRTVTDQHTAHDNSYSGLGRQALGYPLELALAASHARNECE